MCTGAKLYNSIYRRLMRTVIKTFGQLKGRIITKNTGARVLNKHEDKACHAVAQRVKALLYKPEGRGFDSRWCHWNFLLAYSFRPHYGPGGDSAANRNEYQQHFLRDKGGRCVGLTNLPPSCDDCLEICEPHIPGTLRACPGL
jgi:hypothetical protein